MIRCQRLFAFCALALVARPDREELEPPTPLSIVELREARARRLGRGDARHGRR